jgi:hypothetical protein
MQALLNLPSWVKATLVCGSVVAVFVIFMLIKPNSDETNNDPGLGSSDIIATPTPTDPVEPPTTVPLPNTDPIPEPTPSNTPVEVPEGVLPDDYFPTELEQDDIAVAQQQLDSAIKNIYAISAYESAENRIARLSPFFVVDYPVGDVNPVGEISANPETGERTDAAGTLVADLPLDSSADTYVTRVTVSVQYQYSPPSDSGDRPTIDKWQDNLNITMVKQDGTWLIQNIEQEG